MLSNGPIDTKIDTKLLAGRSKNGSSVYADSPYTGAYLRQEVGNSNLRESGPIHPSDSWPWLGHPKTMKIVLLPRLFSHQ